MNLLQKYDEYIKGEMTDDEMDHFTTEILKDHYDNQALKNKWRKLLADNDELNRLKKESQKQALQSKTISRIPHKLLAVAAAILFLLGFFFLYPSDPLPMHQQLVEQYLEKPFPFNGARKGTDALTESELRLYAGDLYYTKSYDESIAAYQKIISQNGGIPQDFLYLGLNYLYQKKSDQAILQFKKIIETDTQSFKKEATWFLSLAYLQKNDFANAKIYLEEITSWKNKEENRNWDKQLVERAELLLRAVNGKR